VPRKSIARYARAMPDPIKPRRFPPPWSIADYNDACFIVRDHNGQALALLKNRPRRCGSFGTAAIGQKTLDVFDLHQSGNGGARHLRNGRSDARGLSLSGRVSGGPAGANERVKWEPISNMDADNPVLVAG